MAMRGGAPVPRDHYIFHQQYMRAQDMIGQTARSPYVQRYVLAHVFDCIFVFNNGFTFCLCPCSSLIPGAGPDPKDLTADADERPATSPPMELRRIVAASAAAAAAAAAAANNANAVGNVAMRFTTAAAVPHSLHSPQDQRATGKYQSSTHTRTY